VVDLTIVAAVNDRRVLDQCLNRSPDIEKGRVGLLVRENYPSASIALNAGIRAATSRYVALVHQDVYLPDGWVAKVDRALMLLNKIDDRWAIVGVFGRDFDGQDVGKVWSTDVMREYGRADGGAVRVQSLDECVLIVDKDRGLYFDENLPHFHLYAADFILTGESLDLRSYVIDAPVVHHSVPVHTVRGGYATAYRYVQRKWSSKLPWPTLIVPLAHGALPLWRGEGTRVVARIRRKLSSLCGRGLPSRDRLDPRKIAKLAGYE
jgi:glycosyltransferase involved in cell wall biosynthesis